ncbi:hypothetical protein [Luteitalea pratensis]|uniref:LGFP repeat-containing protein n=1 Tax=Luteitalea pratensis TaxID=1855912 RepID=UPI000D725555
MLEPSTDATAHGTARHDLTILTALDPTLRSSFNAHSRERGSFNLLDTTSGAHEVRGAIRALWTRRAAERSPLGYPISDEFSTGRGDERRSKFERGSISWTSARGARVDGEVAIDPGTALHPVDE